MSQKVLSVAVMAHPSREKYFPYLTERLGEVPFSIDREHAGLWANCRRAWLQYDKDALFHTVLQDDAIVCDDFKARAEKVVHDAEAVMGGNPFAISFYHGNKAEFLEEARRGLAQGYVLRERPGWGIAICLPTKLIPELVRECDTFNDPQDDERITRFLLGRQMMVYFPLPSLIDHRTNDETPSLVGDPGDNRRAFAFIDSPQ